MDLNKEDFHKYIGERVKYFREIQNISQKELAIICKMEISNLSRIENGRTNITTYNLYKICRCLNITLKDIFEESLKTTTISELGNVKDIFLFKYPTIPTNKQYYVYFVVKDDIVIYVGKSKNIHERLKHNPKVSEGDSVYCISFDDEEETEINEASFIEIINPKLNKQREKVNSSKVNQKVIELKRKIYEHI